MGILQSYRWRRRLAWIGISSALVIGVVVAAILLPKDTGVHYDIEPTGTEPAQTVANVLTKARLTKADRRAINGTLVAFVRTGVTRDDPAAAWNLVTSAMRSGVTRKEWNKGQLPVFPFPAQIPDKPSWTVLNSYPGDVTIDLLLQPRSTSKRGPIAFAVNLLKSKHGAWLVDSMIPEQAFEASTPPEKAQKQAKVPNGQLPKGKLSTLWFIVPGTLLALIALVPVLFLLNTWRRNRAIARRYRAERGL
jgi:hypothetical protein